MSNEKDKFRLKLMVLN